MKIFVIAFFPFLIGIAGHSQTTFFISPDGNDTNPGTHAKPFTTISRAQKEARNVSGPVTVYLLEGTYSLKQPVVFTAADSRKESETLTITNFENQPVALSGGVVLHAQWEPCKNGIWRAEITQDFLFDMLFVNGQLQRMARYPNYDPMARFLGGIAADALSKERASRWKSPEGGWQNNRRMGMQEKHRFVENIFEELDTINEWYYDKTSRTLYYFPPAGLDIETATFETPQLAHLIEFRGSEANPVKNISIENMTLTQTLRTFMQNREPLLRSDWTIYRGGASAICFVGDPNSVLSPSFEYGEFVPLAQVDRTPGPKTNNYPAECRVHDNLMFNSGLVEKQSAGVELSMCQSITVSHNTIYDVPRAGINVSEGTRGGHVIESNDVFNTVQESGGHGSFNSWGRDLYRHPDKKVLDVVKPIVIRNNRMRCDHGWDIDLDDGSSNYLIYNNLCLNGGIKLREGVNRVVENNILINNSFHPHAWFRNSNDVFRRNVVSTGYMPINISVWGKEVDCNVFPDSVSLKEAWGRGTDKNPVCGELDFVNPQAGDFRLKEGSIAFSTGFKNFVMDSFGVVSPRLKTVAKKVKMPEIIALDKTDKDEMIDFLGVKVKNLTTLGERSATGMDDTRGVLVVDVADKSGSPFFQTNDVILSFNNKQVNNLRDLLEARMSVIGTHTGRVIYQNQQEIKMDIEFENEQ